MTNIKKTNISIVLPCYNEEAILENNLKTIMDFMDTRRDKYNWEIVIINDGSTDKTGVLAEVIAEKSSQIQVIHHPVNLNLGRALQTGFKVAKGDIIVALDIDLSYSVEHIEKMVDAMIASYADMVVASPYMKGGEVTAVPFLRKLMSKAVNRFMRMASQEKFHTYTGMVRAYSSTFIRSLNLKTKDYEINPEIMYKAMILRARIIEIPAHLDWTEQNKHAGKRSSSIRVLRGVFSGMMSGFIFRPYVFFVGVGTLLMILSMYQLLWLLFDTIKGMAQFLAESGRADNAFSLSLFQQFQIHPQSFLVGGITFLASLQFLGLGFLSLQSKRYYEELFHISSSIKKLLKD